MRPMIRCTSSSSWKSVSSRGSNPPGGTAAYSGGGSCCEVVEPGGGVEPPAGGEYGGGEAAGGLPAGRSWAGGGVVRSLRCGRIRLRVVATVPAAAEASAPMDEPPPRRWTVGSEALPPLDCTGREGVGGVAGGGVRGATGSGDAAAAPGGVRPRRGTAVRGMARRWTRVGDGGGTAAGGRGA